MNIFPKDLQYFIYIHFENNKEILKLYTYPNYSNKNLIDYYYPEKIELNIFLFQNAARCIDEWLKEKGCLWTLFIKFVYLHLFHYKSIFHNQTVSLQQYFSTCF
jgi:hypothetical protein